MTTKSLFQKEWIIWIAVTVPLIYLLIIWSRLPDTVPIHWNIKGEVDGYGSKTAGALLPSLINLFLYLLLYFIPRLDPKRMNYDKFTGAYFTIRLSVSLLLSLLTILVLRMMLGDTIDFGRIVLCSVSLLFAVIGNAMKDVKPNWFVGIRTPWTMENEEVWAKTHLFGGKLWLYGGFFLFLLYLVAGVESPAMIVIFVTGIMTLAITPIIYSYRLYTKIKSSKSV